jgi:ribosomal protein S17
VRWGKPQTPWQKGESEMAIYHMTMKPFRRSEGRSATAAVAYRSGTRIMDERTGEVFDFRRKQGIVSSRLFLPGGYAEESEKFWNRVEMHHKRWNAVTAREIELSLPHELTDKQRKDLVFEFVEYLVEKYRIAIEASIHRPSRKGSDKNEHVHLSLTACSVDDNGTLGKKVVILDPIHCKRHKLKTAAEVERPVWERMVNTALVAAKIDARVDHRSFKERGIFDKLPGRHLGPVVKGMEERGLQTDRSEDIRKEIKEFQYLVLEQSRLESELAEAQRDDFLNENIDESFNWRGFDFTGRRDMIVCDDAMEKAVLIENSRKKEIERLKKKKQQDEKEYAAQVTKRRKKAHLVFMLECKVPLRVPAAYSNFLLTRSINMATQIETLTLERKDLWGEEVFESVVITESAIELHGFLDIESAVCRMVASVLEWGLKLENISAQGAKEFIQEFESQQSKIIKLDRLVEFQKEIAKDVSNTS